MILSPEPQPVTEQVAAPGFWIVMEDIEEIAFVFIQGYRYNSKIVQKKRHLVQNVSTGQGC